MKRYLIVLMACSSFWACVPKKKFKLLQTQHAALEANNRTNLKNLERAELALQGCNDERTRLEKELSDTKAMNMKLISQSTEMAMLSKQGAENLQNSLEKMKEKDLQIKNLNEAINKRDSMTIALVTQLKRAVGTENENIEVNVEKGVIMVSISDKFLFTTGSYEVNKSAYTVLKDVAAVLKDRPTFDVLVEGHTDNVPFKKGDLIDNWDLSVKRATSLSRTLVQQFQIDPKRLIPAGRGAHIPIASNDTAEGRAKNRRTRIVVMPKIDEFYGMIEEGMKGDKK
jgi:chemotaxis protein MotB